MKNLKESHLRSFLKGITWRIIATSTIVVIAYFTTGSIETAITIGTWEFFTKLMLYYMHERIWLKVPLGTIRRIIGVKN